MKMATSLAVAACIVEDEMLLAMDLEVLLEEQGCEVLGPVGSVQRALTLLDARRPDVVSLDMNLDGQSSGPIAVALHERNIPFVVLTGYSGKHEEEPIICDAPLVKKPYDTGEYITTLGNLLSLKAADAH